ncbi:hypothetical protein D3C87_1326870 [compost metagenome]
MNAVAGIAVVIGNTVDRCRRVGGAPHRQQAPLDLDSPGAVGQGEAAGHLHIGQGDALLVTRLIGVVAQKVELLNPGVDISVVAQMGRIDLVDRRAPRVEQIVGEIGAVGENRIGGPQGPVVHRLERTICLHGTTPVTLRIGKGEGRLVALIEARRLDAE